MTCSDFPQVRPSSSGPQFATTANGTPPQQPLQQSPAVAMASGSPLHNCVARSPQTPTQAQTQTVSRPGNGYMMNPGPGVGQSGTGTGAAGVAPGGQSVGAVTPELSPAEQLKAMAQQRAKLLQQKQQQQQQAANWSPAGAPTSPYNSGPFNQDKPNSPMMYPPQAFNTPQGPLVAGMAPNNGPKAPMSNYLPHNHMGMMGQQQSNSMNQSSLSKQQQQTAAMLSYNNTKPLSHFSGSGPVDHIGQRMTPPMAGNNQVKNPMMPPYMGGGGGGGGGQVTGPGQTQGPIPGQTAHLSEEQKRMLLMKQKVLNQNIPYSAMQPHGQVREGVKGHSEAVIVVLVLVLVSVLLSFSWYSSSVMNTEHLWIFVELYFQGQTSAKRLKVSCCVRTLNLLTLAIKKNTLVLFPGERC